MAVLRRLVSVLGTAVLALGAGVAVNAAPAVAAAGAGPRSFSCTGSLGEPLTVRTVTGLLTADHIPYQIVVTGPGGVIESKHAANATLIGNSALHAGYLEWDVTGHAHGDLYYLHIPPVLPGKGGFFDADLDIEFAGGVNGSWQIPMFDCSVTGGPRALAHPIGPRSFSCTGGLGEAYTIVNVTGALSKANAPSHIVVTQVQSGRVLSTRAYAVNLGTSWLNPNYVQWDVTGHAYGDLYYLHVPAVLPPVGGFFDGYLEIEFNGGAAGNWQIPLFDCTVS